MTESSPLPWDTLPSVNPLVPMATTPAESQSVAYDSQRDSHAKRHQIIVIGAGLAGCWTARTLAEKGFAVRIVDQYPRAAAGASGNPVGIVKPYVTRAPSLAMTFHALAHRFLLQQLRQWKLSDVVDFHPCGVWQLVRRAYPKSTAYRNVDAQTAATNLAWPLDSLAIEFDNSGWLNPGKLCQNLLNHPLICTQFDEQVQSLNRVCHTTEPYWQLTLNESRTLQAKHVVLACGEAVNLIPDVQHLPLIPARGQISHFALKPNCPPLRRIINGKHYVIPHERSVWVGATFERDTTDRQVRDSDHASNLAGLRHMLAGFPVETTALAGHTGIRATTPDRLPVAGPVPDFRSATDCYSDLRHGRAHCQYSTLPVVDDLYIIGGLGSRGIVTAPLCAQLVVDVLTGHKAGNESWQAWAPMLNPVRFLIRALKRGVIENIDSGQ